MKIHPIFLRSMIVMSGLAMAFIGVETALAHGTPVIAVQPTVVAAGGQITVTGSAIEVGESFTLTLDGISGTTTLGKVTAATEGQEGGFTATYTVPSDEKPGNYTVQAIAEDGDATTTDLTITAPTSAASAGPAMVQEASAAPHVIDRAKPLAEDAGIIIVALVSGLLGLWLVRPRGQTP